jgi:hypothetical protein
VAQLRYYPNSAWTDGGKQRKNPRILGVTAYNGRDSNRQPPEYKYRAFSLDQAFRYSGLEFMVLWGMMACGQQVPSKLLRPSA